MKIEILHSNDVHSQLENQMRMGHALCDLRSDLLAQGHPVLTFDIGDVLDRVRPETEATLGNLNAQLLAAIGVDGWVFGNNEGLTIPRAKWNEIVEKSQSVVFGTNIRDDFGQPLPAFADTYIYDAAGITVGVFGVTPAYPKPYEHLGVRLLDPLQAASDAVRSLRAAGANVVIALSHLGLRADHALAQAVPDIDLILGGHTHHFMDAPVYEGNTAIYQVGKHALAFGHTTLTIDDETKRVQKISGITIHPHVTEPVDAKMVRVYNSYAEEIEAYLNTPVCELKIPLQASLHEESSFPDLLAECLYEEYPADCGILVAGLVGASLLAGTVRKRHIHAACSTPTRPTLVTISGRELLSVLERGLQPDFASQKGFGFGFRGSLVGSLGLANLEVVARRAINDGTEGESNLSPRPKLRVSAVGGGEPQVGEPQVFVEEVRVGGKPLEFEKLYRIATVEYLWLAPLFPEIRQGRDVDIPAPLLRDVLTARMQDKNDLTSSLLPRIHWM